MIAVEAVGNIQGCLPAALGHAAALDVVRTVVERGRQSASGTSKEGHKPTTMDRKYEQGRTEREKGVQGGHDENTYMVRPTIASPRFSDICWKKGTMNDWEYAALMRV